MPGVVLMSAIHHGAGAGSRRMAMRLFPFFATDRQKDKHGRMGACMCTCMCTHIYLHTRTHTQSHLKKGKATAIENRLFYHSWIVPTL